MATAWKIHIDPQNTGLWKVKQIDEVAKKTTELLQHDLESHHVTYDDIGRHNHIVHHILSLYGTGAPPQVLQTVYDTHAAYQRPARPPTQHVVDDLQSSWAQHAKAYLGNAKYYADFLAFFQRDIAARGCEAVLAERLFAGTAAADDLLVRLFAGFLHPLIQMLYALEWKQPAIVAAALAQACIHDLHFRDVLVRAERDANEIYAEGNGGSMPRILALLEEARADEKIRTAVQPGDGGLLDGLLERAPEELLRIVSRVKVRPEELEERTAEMFDTALFMSAAASFHPLKANKLDFFFIHHVTSAPFFLIINAQPWIPVEVKARLLEWKIRYDIMQYAGRGVPALSLDQLKAYQPRAETASIPDMLDNMYSFLGVRDDEHVIKLFRAALITQEMSKPYQDCSWMLIKGDDMWMRIYRLIADSVATPGPVFVRTTGLEEAWIDVPVKSTLQS